jgi:hypothetical protein
MAAGSQRPGDAASNVDHWLRRCEGFRVDSAHGRVGFVEEVRYASRFDRPDVIAVRAGLLGRLLLIVPVEEIAQILPSEERIVLRHSPRPTATEHLPDRREPAHGGAGAKRLEARKEVRAVSKRLTRLIGLRFWRGGEQEMTSDVEASAEPPAEPAAEEKAAEEPVAEEAPAEGPAAEAMPAEEPAAEQRPVEEQAAEEQPTA